MASALCKFDGVFACHLTDVYDDDQRVKDEQWIADAGQHGWWVITQNPNMSRVRSELDMIEKLGTKVFSLSNAELLMVEKGLIFGRYFLMMKRRALKPAGCFWRLSQTSTVRTIP